MKTTVYIVKYNELNDFGWPTSVGKFAGAFSTKKKAEEYIKSKGKNYSIEYEVEDVYLV